MSGNLVFCHKAKLSLDNKVFGRLDTGANNLDTQGVLYFLLGNFSNSKLIPSVCQRVSPLAAEHQLYTVLWDMLGTRRDGTHPAA